MSEHQRHTTAAADRVPWSQLIAYGMGGLIPIAIFNIAGQLMGLLGNISLGLSAFWLGTIMIIPRLWDAVSDPIVGHLSDRTRTRWGRRRPFILLGGIGTALSFVAMWWVPRGDWFKSFFASQAAYNWFQLAYILGGLLFFFTATTVFEIPHGALGMEMSGDYHERTRLFSAKSFLGNLFAMGTPWLILLAGPNYFGTPGGDLVDGMRRLSLIIAAVLIPLTIWWFVALREPSIITATEQRKGTFWSDMRATAGNSTFIKLVLIIFTLAMGFNFVALFGYYIQIFYLYGGDATAAGTLLGVSGTIWAITALVAVFPLNWLSKRYGKNTTLLIAILLMCAAQLSKIVCYRPGVLFQFDSPLWICKASEWLHHWSRLFPVVDRTITVPAPFLILIPMILLSAGMLMFFTLGSSMVGDICDEDELNSGRRSEGSYYAVYWWFIKMGTAFASFVTGALLVYTTFDEQQNVLVDKMIGHVAAIKAEADASINASMVSAKL
ncbi:MAG TPA: MFS transporter, partial [Lacipirellulaceae bacterium]|nr:MFS transporter [Lacipirellulaceae bacterium]